MANMYIISLKWVFMFRCILLINMLFEISGKHHKYLSLTQYPNARLINRSWAVYITDNRFSCFLTCLQVSQETTKVVWYSHHFKNFPQFIVIHIIKGFSILNEVEVFSGIPFFSLWSNKCRQFDPQFLCLY